MFKDRKKQGAVTTDPGPPPPVVKLPDVEDPDLRRMEIEQERKIGKRKGRSSTLVSGQLGDQVVTPPKLSKPLIGGY